ncbi:hypothetical protein [Mesorhizobium sp.]|uniref:hypothetical protein n=1 Tax=Mesorhizobium sp. TaxID=1871066 RepID=UPI000FE9ACFD|nr:hypothetical protein [Mesorhizobium sp.]RWO77205.1 MAG: hypothetical protein EOQ95_31750 [Mesorhizobium sp.]RWQ45632.1 MAG: hypothetical protein EOS84_31635 [Mesorhizobium sp.]TIM05707.1 MAG: hypothetical protein E5Y62_26810 [Mesorhizobium sp.]
MTGDDATPAASKGFGVLVASEPSPQEVQIQELQPRLVYERDARLEERFVFIVLAVMLLDIVFFTVMPTFGGPIALLILQLLVLIPMAKRMGMEEIARILGRVLDRMVTKGNEND